MKQLILAPLVLSMLAGCTGLQIRPLATVEHTSHITQHFGKNRTNYGWEVYSVGVRVRSQSGGFTLDLLDGYTPQQVDGRHEVFSGRLTWEIGK